MTDRGVGSGKRDLLFIDNLLDCVMPSGMMLLALAAQMSLPVPANPGVADLRAIFSASDFPVYLQKLGVSRSVFTRTTVRPDGSIQDCVAEGTSGDPKLDAFTCGIISKRAKFRPAAWTDGTAAYGVIRVPVQWVIDYRPQTYVQRLATTTPDLELTVSKLPKGAQTVAAAYLEIAADENGRAVACQEDAQAAKSDPEHRYLELTPIACEQVLKILTVSPVTDPSGKAVRSIQNVRVHFKLDPASASRQAEGEPPLNADTAMAFLIATLPGLRVMDTWDGGWLEAKLDGAGTGGRCKLTTKAPSGFVHEYGGTREVERQNSVVDFSKVTGVGQNGTRAIYKLAKVDRVLGIEAGTPERALRIAQAYEALRQACSSRSQESRR